MGKPSEYVDGSRIRVTGLEANNDEFPFTSLLMACDVDLPAVPFAASRR